MQKLRKRSKVESAPEDDGKRNVKPSEKKQKPAQRIGNFVRYGNTVFELHEDKGDSIYCTILEVSCQFCSRLVI